MHYTILPAETHGDLTAVRELFTEYRDFLGDEVCFRDFEHELNTLPGKYSPPEGILLLARVAEKPAGCVAIRPLEQGICELKRLFVRGQFRGLHLGRRLVESALDFARNAGYKAVRLDSIPVKMQQAISLYESLGFKLIEKYYESTHSESIYMELSLQ
ncbi:MAG TPA: GNAT family N-acetyltransferase [Pyrinomonadaceae bacterium]|nr:GNAT family N-acetyltransferase [Pyrinomonadaceae bacterium]